MNPQPNPLARAFAGRLTQACDKAGVPPLHHGRLGWLREKVVESGDQVTVEGVRKWLAGEVFPRPKKVKILAKALAVDEGWLHSGATSGMAETSASFRHGAPVPADLGQAFLDRIQMRFAGTVTIMPGVDLTDPTWDEGDDVGQ
ncbi:hypothetical protein [Brevundimonas sp.]|uniref:hypothetical protein n=1 Tax=Brevundimonas sp. TaxID=1871086 RepID=UPI002E145E6D|nr:hypothetical protein [Brevundimonas sp.]